MTTPGGEGGLRYRWYDVPAGRKPESFPYVVVELWQGAETDRLYTDDAATAVHLVALMLDSGHDVRVEQRP